MNADTQKTVDAMRVELLFLHAYKAALRYEYDLQAIDRDGGKWRDDQREHYAETEREIVELSASIREMGAAK